MIATQIDTNMLQKGGAAEEGGHLMTLPEIVPIDQIAPPVLAEPPPPLSLAEGMITLAELYEADIPEPESLVGSWWLEENIGFLYGERGRGKSWMGLNLACCLAEGRDCGPWRISKPRRVLYVDGEMNVSAIRKRIRAMGQSPDAPLHLLSRKYRVGRRRIASLDLTDPSVQKELLELCWKHKIEVLILDNHSCLFFGIRENDADDWGQVLNFLQEMQALGVSPCIVHHAGRAGGHMRGTSRREDGADWMMQVAATDDNEPPEAGYKTKFVSEFTKSRTGIGEDAGPWEWTYETPAEGEATTIRWSLLSRLKVFVKHIEEGLEQCSEIAEAMGVRNDIVSKLAKKAAEQNLIKIEGSGNRKRYLLR
ncbi:hypothetical protein AXK11_01505 [Cephaloticoccus primus]|uniref:AAA+ ATPase domain-containing protein n=1 Tax=Cephaloticoccus primus TaxID=1548207 RepID=A0A139STE8_9BACT|nr:AAA family ATPase [Cephaloticoccus primus]KXU37857.1 hypothetical protein AXK11_01505 [Cephaloticoccus primus]